MNILRKISIKYLLLVPVLFALSCGEDFLDLQPQQSLSTDVAIANLSDMKAAVIGIYDEMQSATTYGRYFILIPDVQSDDVKQNGSPNRVREYAEYTQDATDGPAESLFANLYQIIDRANRVIHNNVAIPAAEDEYNQAMGEAYALRGLAHFDLVRAFSQHYTYTADASHQGVVITTDVDPLRMPSPRTVAEVYSQVVSDFQTAIPLLVVDPSSVAFMSQDAAKALLSRVYLYMEDYANCITLANDVINNSGVSLMDSAACSTEWADYDSYMSEALFEIAFTQDDRNGSDGLGGMYNTTGYGDYLPSTDILALFPAGDVRADLFYEDLSLPGGVYGTTRVGKYPDNLGRNHTKMIRLAEVYLNLAEAMFMENGGSATVDGLLNDLLDNRFPAHPVVSGATLADILLQRRLELCFEGDRLWTLMRHKMDMVRIVDCTAPGACNITYPNDRFIMPVPQQELDVNPNMTQTGSTY